MRISVLSLVALALIACPGGKRGGGGDDDSNGTDAGNTIPTPDAGSVQQDVTIRDLQTGVVPLDTSVELLAVTVTAVQEERGFWVQQGSGPESGIYVFGAEAVATGGLEEGAEIDLRGEFAAFNDLNQIKFPTVTAVRPGTPIDPQEVSAADLVNNPAWEGVLVRTSNLTISNANPDRQDGQPCPAGEPDCTDYGQMTVDDGLILDDDIFRSLSSGRYFLRAVGTRFTSVIGIAHLSFGSRKLLPRKAADLDVVGGPPDFTVRVQEIQQGSIAEGLPVSLRGVVVTGITHESEEQYRGLWVQQDRGQYAGIYVFFGRNPLPAVSIGSVVDLDGDYSEFYGQSQIVRGVVRVTGNGAAPEPSIVLAAEIGGAADGDNHSNAEPWEGVLVVVEDVAITNANPDAEDGEPCAPGAENCRDFGTIEVTGGLRISKRMLPNFSAGQLFDRSVGTRFSRIVGIAEEAFGHHSLAPRQASDLTIVP